MCGGQHWTKMKYSSPTRLALDPCELKFHKRIARGAFGSVYLATDPNGYKYAVKRSRKFGTKRSRELINLGLCKDASNIMQYMGTFYTRNRNGILMQNSLFEHVPYNLRSFIRHMRGNMESHCERNGSNAIASDNPSHAAAQVTRTKDYLILRVLCDVVNGILELHGRDLVHRDLKPDNILIDDDKSPTIAKICDLGSAKRINRLSMTARSDSDMTVEPSTPYVCSRWYRAPELLFGRTYYSASVDNWSFGCICAEMLLLNPLFSSADQSDAHQVLHMIEILGTPSRSELRRILENAPCSSIARQMEILFQSTYSKGTLRTILTDVAKGNSSMMTIANIAYNLLRWCPEDRISMEDAYKMLTAGLTRCV